MLFEKHIPEYVMYSGYFSFPKETYRDTTRLKQQDDPIHSESGFK